jgi:predicted HAD superfamily Cof-like phosphohydrolase
MKRQLAQVQGFHEAFDVPIETTPTAQIPEELSAMRARIMQEELDEYRAACAAGDIVEIADALTDLLYVVFGTVITHGLQDVAVELFDEVHRSNISKLDENGRPLHREDGKVLKSERFSPPDLGAILSRYLR